MTCLVLHHQASRENAQKFHFCRHYTADSVAQPYTAQFLTVKHNDRDQCEGTNAAASSVGHYAKPCGL